MTMTNTGTTPKPAVEAPKPVAANASAVPAAVATAKPGAPTPTNVRIPKDEMDEGVHAAPLVLPDFTNVKAKNPAIALRWVNYSVGEERNSLRFEQMKAAGWACAEPSDVVGLTANYVKDNRLIHGDLILMKHDRLKVLGALKNNVQNARKLGSRFSAKDRAVDAMREANAPRSQASKAQFYQPAGSELPADFREEPGPGTA